MLVFLAKSPGWVFTRNQILDGVHGGNYAITERAVDVQIVGLRKKLGPAGSVHRDGPWRGLPIQGVAGVGKRLVKSLFLSYLWITLAAVVLVGFYAAHMARELYLDRTAEDLEARARLSRRPVAGIAGAARRGRQSTPSARRWARPPAHGSR